MSKKLGIFLFFKGKYARLIYNDYKFLLMLHVNISHTEYDQAIKALQDACPDLSHVELAIDFSADHAQSKIVRDFVGKIFDYHNVKTPW